MSCSTTFTILSKPQLNHNLTQPQPNITLVGFAMRMTLHNPSPPPPHPPHSMSEISQLLLTKFLWNLKDRFQETSWTDPHYQVDICQGNICPGDICPYPEYISCYWPNFDETLKEGSWEHLEQIPTIKLTFVKAIFVLVIFVHIRNTWAVTELILMKL